MRKVLLALFVLAALVIGLGFYLGWFSIAPRAQDNTNAPPSQLTRRRLKPMWERRRRRSRS
jgi:hypothetical protein